MRSRRRGVRGEAGFKDKQRILLFSRVIPRINLAVAAHRTGTGRQDMSSSSSPRRLNPPPPPPPPPPSSPPPFVPARVANTLAILRSVDTAATLVCNEIDNTTEPEHEEPEHEERQALKDLRKGVENLRSDIIVYNVLLKDLEHHHMWRYVMGLRSHAEPIIHNITDCTERKEWKALRGCSRLHN